MSSATRSVLFAFASQALARGARSAKFFCRKGAFLEKENGRVLVKHISIFIVLLNDFVVALRIVFFSNSQFVESLNEV